MNKNLLLTGCILVLISTLILSKILFVKHQDENSEISIPYSFTFVGHSYQVDEFFNIKQQTDFTIYGGDVVYEACQDWHTFDSQRLRSNPDQDYYVVPGNHELLIECPEEFLSRFPRYHSFYKNNDLFILLDATEDWQISGDQLRWFEYEITKKAVNIFIFVHQLIMVDSIDFDWKPNSNMGRPNSTNFDTHIKPLLEEAAINSSVYVFVGDMGQHPPPHSYYDQTVNGVRYIGAGLGLLGSSYYYQVNVDSNDNASLKLLDANY